MTTPVAEAERLEALDLLRGVAVLGILIVNMQLLAMPNAAGVNPYAAGTPSTRDLHDHLLRSRAGTVRPR